MDRKEKSRCSGKTTTRLAELREKTEQSTKHIDLRRCVAVECKKKCQSSQANDNESDINLMNCSQGQSVCRVKPLPRCTVVSEDGKKTSFLIQNQIDGTLKLIANGKEYDPGESVKQRLARMKIPQCKVSTILPHEESLSFSDINDCFMTDTDTDTRECFKTATKLITKSTISSRPMQYEECKRKIKEMSESLQKTSKIIKIAHDKMHKKSDELLKDTIASKIKIQVGEDIPENLIKKTAEKENDKEKETTDVCQKCSYSKPELPQKSEEINGKDCSNNTPRYRPLSRLSCVKKKTKKVSFDNVISTINGAQGSLQNQTYKHVESSDSSCDEQSLAFKQLPSKKKKLQTSINSKTHLAKPIVKETLGRNQKIRKLQPSIAKMQTADIPSEGKDTKPIVDCTKEKSNLTKKHSIQDFLKSLEERQLYIPHNKKNRRKWYDCCEMPRRCYLAVPQTCAQKAKKPQTDSYFLNDLKQHCQTLLSKVLCNSFAAFVFINAIGSLTSDKLTAVVK